MSLKRVTKSAIKVLQQHHCHIFLVTCLALHVFPKHTATLLSSSLMTIIWKYQDIICTSRPLNQYQTRRRLYLPSKMSTLGVLNIVYLNECINSVGDKTSKFVFLYRSSSQSQDVFEKFCESFERTFDNLPIPFFWML